MGENAPPATADDILETTEAELRSVEEADDAERIARLGSLYERLEALLDGSTAPIT